MKEQKSSKLFWAILIFIVGIVALVALIGYSIWNSSPPYLLGGEAAVLVSLIALLIYSLSARKKQLAIERNNLRSPYGDVDNDQISRIFDMIDKEERKRGGVFIKTGDKPAEKEASSADSEKEEAAAASKASAEDEDDDPLPIIFPDLEDEDNSGQSFVPLSEERAAARREKREKEAAKAQNETEDIKPAEEPTPEEEKPAEQEPAAAEPVPEKIAEPAQKTGVTEEGGKGMDNNSRPRKKAPGVLYDAYGRPMAAPAQRPQQPVGYDAYGRPVYAQRPAQKKPRTPIGYDAYGRPIFAPVQKKPRVPVGYDAYGRPVYAPSGAKRPGQQRRRPPMQPGQMPAGQAPVQSAPLQAPVQQPPVQIPSEPMAASAADALASIEAQQQNNVAAGYYDEDYIPVVIRDEDEVDYDDDRYTPRVRAGLSESKQLTDADTVPLYTQPTVPSQPLRQLKSEYNLGAGMDSNYKPDYSAEDMPVIVPSFDDDAEVDYSVPQGFTPPPDYTNSRTYQSSGAPIPAQQRKTGLDPRFNASSADDYTRDADEDSFVFVPHFDDDDPLPPPEPEKPKEPSWKMAKMRRRKVRRRSRQGMLFKVKDMSFVDYTTAIIEKANK